MTQQIREIDRFEPDYDSVCLNCGQTPTVTGIIDGKVDYASDMCGPCTWGEAAMLDPDAWNS